MTGLIHGHDVLGLIDDASAGIDRAELQRQIQAIHGPDARFTTCSGASYDFDELLAFLFERDKIRTVDGKLQVVRENICGG